MYVILKNQFVDVNVACNLFKFTFNKWVWRWDKQQILQKRQDILWQIEDWCQQNWALQYKMIVIKGHKYDLNYLFVMQFWNWQKYWIQVIDDLAKIDWIERVDWDVYEYIMKRKIEVYDFKQFLQYKKQRFWLDK